LVLFFKKGPLRLSERHSAAFVDEMVDVLPAKAATFHTRNRAHVLAQAAARGIAVASHDARDEAEIALNMLEGITIAEFPVYPYML
jgi:alpha-D-ribose 1-methylphosphonate 5-triphosphate diphosphatase PhnM